MCTSAGTGTAQEVVKRRSASLMPVLQSEALAEDIDCVLESSIYEQAEKLEQCPLVQKAETMQMMSNFARKAS